MPDVFELLDIDQEELQQQVVDRLVSQFAHETALTLELQAYVRQEVSNQLRDLSSEVVEPRVEALLKDLTFQGTNKWGEPKQEPQTLREHIDTMVVAWFNEPVDHNGLSREEYRKKHHSTGWDGARAQPRLMYVIDKKIHALMAQKVHEVFKDSTELLASTMQESLSKAVAVSAEKLKRSIERTR